MLISDRKRETLNTGLAKTCLPASFLSLILWLLLPGKLKNTNPLHRVSQQKNRMKLRKNWGKQTIGCSFTIQFQLTQQLTAIQMEIFCILHHLHFFLLAPHSQHLSSVASGSQQIRKLTYPPNHHIGSVFKKSKKLHEQEQRGGGTTLVGNRKRARRRVDLPVQQ